MAKRGARPKRETKKPKSGKRQIIPLSDGLAPPAEPLRVSRKRKPKEEIPEDVEDEG